MINVTKIKDAGAAFDYYSEKDDYYMSDRTSAEWHGHGAEALGLIGEIDPRDFRDALRGQVGGVQVGTPERHTPGWDVTFSAPKSVSVAALVNKDERLIAAHDRAVRAALDYIERHAIVTRQRGRDGDYEYRRTGNMVAGVVRHSTNRNADAQLHSHAVTANITVDPVTGKAVSIDSRQGLYAIQVEANNVYSNELAADARDAGYTIDWEVRGRDAASFELREIPESIREAFSSRKQEIDAELAARGTTRAAAGADEREAATIATRAKKEQVPAAELHRRWEDRARGLGYEPGTRPAGASEVVWGDREAAAVEAIKAGVAHLAERTTRFTERDALAAARVAAQGRVREGDLVAALAAARRRGELIDRETLQDVPGGTKAIVPGLTTREAVKTETDMLRHADAIARSRQGKARVGERETGDNSRGKIDEAMRRQEKRSGHKFTGEQRDAVRGIMESSSGLHIVQGYAGTAKTTSVLATVAAEARAAGWDVRAIAPTSSAAKTLGDAIGVEGRTLASQIHQQPKRGATTAPGALMIVDEAGMASARDKEALLAQCAKAGNVVVLVGDEKQIGSVGAGAAFEQIKAAHASDTYELTEIKRQTSRQLEAAVYDAIRGDAKAALGKVEVHEHASRDAATQAIADDYMRHANVGEDTLVVTLSRDDRRDVNAAIQERREAAGEVKDVREVATWRDKQMTEAQRADAARYQPGDGVQAGRDFKRGLAKGEIATVTEVRDGRVTAVTSGGKEWKFDPAKVKKITTLEPDSTRMGRGDIVVAKGPVNALDANGKKIGIKNGVEMRVKGVRNDGRVEVQMGSGKNTMFATIDAAHGVRVDLAYAQTANQAQGRGVDTCIADARSTQAKLADQQRMYVIMSRAKQHVAVHTDDKEKLAQAIERNTGRKETAIERGGETRERGAERQQPVPRQRAERTAAERKAGERQQTEQRQQPERHQPEQWHQPEHRQAPERTVPEQRAPQQQQPERTATAQSSAQRQSGLDAALNRGDHVAASRQEPQQPLPPKPDRDRGLSMDR